jgi:hypothetical protein
VVVGGVTGSQEEFCIDGLQAVLAKTVSTNFFKPVTLYPLAMDLFKVVIFLI